MRNLALRIILFSAQILKSMCIRTWYQKRTVLRKEDSFCYSESIRIGRKIVAGETQFETAVSMIGMENSDSASCKQKKPA